LCISYIPWTFLSGYCPAIGGAQTTGDDLSLSWAHPLQYCGFEIVLLA